MAETKYAKEYFDNIKRLKNPDTQEQEALNAFRGTLAGGVVGGIAGLMYAQSRKVNLMFGAFAGALLGGMITRAFVIKK